MITLNQITDIINSPVPQWAVLAVLVWLERRIRRLEKLLYTLTGEEYARHENRNIKK